ncbi:centrosomal protein of 131 kDa-like isoform X2 [Aphidius gifuensis]|uniref:centrosomal protein of 131 kDa-like isoform X2 n=1 Tax=Aphidius gifuensis TaxID=684658 RepID=UPI001CDD0255|nr:centrosomal protein of 131 kDa-like isoform X2 [Aphidius gifuensis]
MISIVHPQVATKPPINKHCTIKKPLKKCKLIQKKLDNNNNINEKSEALKKDTIELPDSCNNNSNQKFIDNNSTSFDKLCNMINDLEKNLQQEHEVLSVNQCFLPTEEVPVASTIDHHEQPEKDKPAEFFIKEGSTYEDIMKFLNTLDDDCSIPDFLKIEKQLNNNKLPQNIEDFFLQKNKQQIDSNNSTRNKNIIIGKIRDDELATALLKLEDREATLKLLKDELKNERKQACDKLSKQKFDLTNELQNQKIKYQNIIKRHQKFIEQLIEEKKVLTEKCDILGQKIKEIEIKQQKDIKVLIDRHAIEIQRARELCMASEKIRRERWLEAKTSKIKEMTVKGLEPELRSMVDQHQQEIQDIRSAHMKELQDVELRTIRRSNQQLEQLRIELTESHDKILTNEKDAMRMRFQIKYEEQEKQLQIQQRNYFQQLENEKIKFNNELSKKTTDYNLSLEQLTQKFQDKIEQLKCQNDIEKKNIKEIIDAEKEAWINNFKRQQNIKLSISEANLREQIIKERDEQIELTIDRYEKEKNNIKINLQRETDNTIKCLKDKYESELQVVCENEKLVRDKLLLAEEKYNELEIKLEKTETKLGKCLADFKEETCMVERLTRERDHAKKLARQEIEHEKRELEDKISSLYKEITEINKNRDTHMTQLYSRIKLIITQKDMSIKNITNQANDFKNKCEHLEKLLDQQRKEYVLKNL